MNRFRVNSEISVVGLDGPKVGRTYTQAQLEESGCDVRHLLNVRAIQPVGAFRERELQPTTTPMVQSPKVGQAARFMTDGPGSTKPRKFAPEEREESDGGELYGGVTDPADVLSDVDKEEMMEAFRASLAEQFATFADDLRGIVTEAITKALPTATPDESGQSQTPELQDQLAEFEKANNELAETNERLLQELAEYKKRESGKPQQHPPKNK